jgi:hypothetical protein
MPKHTYQTYMNPLDTIFNCKHEACLHSIGPNFQQVEDALSRSTKVMPKHTYQKYIKQGEVGKGPSMKASSK